MAGDGTSGEVAVSGPEETAQKVVDLYFKNVNTTAIPYDLYRVGNAILGKVEEVEEELFSTNETVTELSYETEKEFKTVEERLTEVEIILAQVIFVLVNTGLDVTNDMENFMEQNLEL